MDAIAEAWPALLASCATSRLPAEWRDACDSARKINAADTNAQRALLESALRAWHVTTQVPGSKGKTQVGLITGYYEPMLNGARMKGGPFQTPLYSVPDDLLSIELGDLSPALKGERVREGCKVDGSCLIRTALCWQMASCSGKELVWVDSPVDAFFLQIQGSGRVRLTDGSTVRLAYADVTDNRIAR